MRFEFPFLETHHSNWGNAPKFYLLFACPRQATTKSATQYTIIIFPLPGTPSRHTASNLVPWSFYQDRYLYRRASHIRLCPWNISKEAPACGYRWSSLLFRHNRFLQPWYSSFLYQGDIGLCRVHLLYEHNSCQEKQTGQAEKLFKVFQCDINF